MKYLVAIAGDIKSIVKTMLIKPLIFLEVKRIILFRDLLKNIYNRLDMILHFSSDTNEVQEIESRLKHLSLAYSKMQSEDLSEPFISDGSKKYIGVKNMNAYIDVLDREKEQWYYCNC